MNATSQDPARTRSVRRRHLTILFSDLCDSTSLAGSMEPEHYLEMVDGIREAAARVVAKHEGTLVELRGDGIVAMFGYPETAETDGRRAAEAALELHEAVSRPTAASVGAQPPELRLHSGIHSGWVLLIESNSQVGRFSIIGEAPNVAARLADTAQRDEILVSAATLGPESHFFEIQERGRLVLRGKSELVSAYRVVRRSSAMSRFEARTRQGLAPFVGRAQQLSVLDRAWAAVTGGEVRTAAIVAGPGVGKTRLAEEFLSRLTPAHSCVVYRGHCDNTSRAEPLQPFLQWVRSLCGLDFGAPMELSLADVTQRLGRHDPALAACADVVAKAWATLANVGNGDVGDGTSRDQASSVRALRDLVEALARAKPAVLFVDDWQWADDATRQTLGAIRQLTGVPLLVLLTSREPTTRDLTIADADVVELTPLDDDASLEAVRALRPDADPFVADRIRRLAGGTPLFIEELCHAASGFGILTGTGSEPDGFGWLNGLIESRVARLPASHVEVLREAAVIGTILPSWLLEAMTGCDMLHPVVRELADRDFLYPGETDGTLRFKHGITRDVIYASVGLRERQALHLRIAEYIEQASRAGQDDAIELLAYHFGAAERPEQAARYAEQAGDKAMAKAAADRARAHYTVALDALDRVADPLQSYPRWSAVVHRLGLACVFDPARDQLAYFRNAADRARSVGRLADLARAEYWLGFIHYGLGESHQAIAYYGASRAHCAEAVTAARTAADSQVRRELEALGVQLLATLGQAHAAAADYDAALAQIDAALDVKRQHHGTRRPSVGLAYTLACKGAVLGDLGRFDDAHACFDEALDSITIGESPVEGSVLGWRSAVYLWQGRWEDARRTAQRVQHTAQRTGSLYVLAMGLVVFNYTNWIISREAGAIDAMIHAISWLEAREKLLSISMSYGWLAESLAAAGRTAESRSYAARALVRARRDDRFGEAQAYRALAMLPWSGHGATPEHHIARAHQAALRRRSPREQAATQLAEARLLAHSGRRQEAAQLLARARAAFGAMKMAWHAAAADEQLAQLSAHVRGQTP